MSLLTIQAADREIKRDHDFLAFWSETKIELEKKLRKPKEESEEEPESITINGMHDLIDSDRLGIAIMAYTSKIIQHYREQLASKKDLFDTDYSFEFIRFEVATDLLSLGLSPDTFQQEWERLRIDLEWLLFLAMNISELMEGVADRIQSINH